MRLRTLRRDGVPAIVGLAALSLPWAPLSALDRWALLILAAAARGQAVLVDDVATLIEVLEATAPVLRPLARRTMRAIERGQGGRLIVSLGEACLRLGRERAALLALLRGRARAIE